MSGFVREFSGYTPTTQNHLTVSVPAAIPAGNSLVAAATILDSGTTIPSITASDTKGNTWTMLHSAKLTGTNTAGYLLSVVITSALTTSDTITFTYPYWANRSAISIAEFNDVLTPDKYATGDNGGAQWLTLVTPATAMTTQANELIYGAWYMLNPGRTFTATNGFTGLTKVTSNAGSSDRAVATEYKYVTSIGQYTANGTFNSNGSAVGMVQTFSTGRTGWPKVWSGSAWVAHPAKVWSGSAWVEHPIKGYDGSSWVSSK